MKELTNIQKAVIEQLGYNPDTDLENEELIGTLEDIVKYGIGGGFTGFVYYGDTVEFFKNNQSDIIDLVENFSSDMGEDPVEFVSAFKCIDDDRENRKEIGECLYCTHRSVEQIQQQNPYVANALAWFAAEEVARQLTEV